MPSLFKPIVAVLCLAFGLCFVAPVAHADSFTPTFTCSGSCLAVPTAPDVSFPSPTTMTESWNGYTITVQFFASNLQSDSYVWLNEVVACGIGGCDVTGEFAQFELFDVNTSSQPFTIPQKIYNVTGPLTVDQGSLLFTPVGAPEPSSLALMLSGVGLVFVMRKRWASGLQQAS